MTLIFFDNQLWAMLFLVHGSISIPLQAETSEMKRLFSVIEANAMLPQLRGLLGRIQNEKDRMLEMEPDPEVIQTKSAYDWGMTRGAEYILILEAFQQAVKEVEELGVLVKDLDQGLCDFPHQRDGRMVYLCWKLDEEEVTWWHDVDAGFAGRQPL